MLGTLPHLHVAHPPRNSDSEIDHLLNTYCVSDTLLIRSLILSQPLQRTFYHYFAEEDTEEGKLRNLPKVCT